MRKGPTRRNMHQPRRSPRLPLTSKAGLGRWKLERFVRVAGVVRDSICVIHADALAADWARDISNVRRWWSAARFVDVFLNIEGRHGGHPSFRRAHNTTTPKWVNYSGG